MNNLTTLRHDKQGTAAFKEITSACILGVSVQTNGPQGGDSGHGCRTHLTFHNIASVDMEVDADDQTIRLVFGGDCELECLAEALRFAADALAPYRGKA